MIVGMSEGVTADIKSFLYHWWSGESEPEPGSAHFAANVQVFIGEVGDGRADSFDLVVCSPGKLAERFQPENWLDYEVLPGGNVLPITGVWVMKAWSRTEFEAAVWRTIPAFSPGPDFASVAARIGRVIPWEYDYRHDDEINRAAGLPPPTQSFWHDD